MRRRSYEHPVAGPNPGEFSPLPPALRGEQDAGGGRGEGGLRLRPGEAGVTPSKAHPPPPPPPPPPPRGGGGGGGAGPPARRWAAGVLGARAAPAPPPPPPAPPAPPPPPPPAPPLH